MLTKSMINAIFKMTFRLDFCDILSIKAALVLVRVSNCSFECLTVVKFAKCLVSCFEPLAQS